MNRIPVSPSSSRSSTAAAPAPAPVGAEGAEGAEGARVVALARDSEVVYAYWDIPSDALTGARGRLGHGALTGRLVLRAHDVTVGNGAVGGGFLEYDVTDSDRDAFIRIAKPGTAQVVEIGLSGDDGSFTSIARSGKVELPRAVPVTWETPQASEVRWMSPPPAPPAPEHVAPPPATVRDMALGAPPLAAVAPPPSFEAARASVTTHVSGTSPRVGWGRSFPLGPGASEAWLPDSSQASRPGPAPEASVPSSTDDRHVRAPVPSRAPSARWIAEAMTAGVSTPESAHEARAPVGVDPGRTGTSLEPASASVDVHDRQPSAAEGVWSPAEVSEQRARSSPGTALERRQLPAAVASPNTAVVVAKPTTPPGWDQITGGLGALARGVLQVTGGALRVAGGIAKLGAWTVQKALETLRKPRS